MSGIPASKVDLALCPLCKSPVMKVIYCGLPGRLCTYEGCNCLTGLATYAPAIASETEDGPGFSFFTYDGSYWRALWHWLRGEEFGDPAA